MSTPTKCVVCVCSILVVVEGVGEDEGEDEGD